MRQGADPPAFTQHAFRISHYALRIRFPFPICVYLRASAVPIPDPFAFSLFRSFAFSIPRRSTMKITHVETELVLREPSPRPIRDALQTLPGAGRVEVRVRTDDGLVGRGDA